MIVDLLNVGPKAMPFDFKMSPDEVDLELEHVHIAGDVAVRGELNRNAGQTNVTGSIRAPIEVDCTRCLTPVKRELDIVFEVTFVPEAMFPDQREAYVESGDLDTDVVAGNELDL